MKQEPVLAFKEYGSKSFYEPGTNEAVSQATVKRECYPRRQTLVKQEPYEDNQCPVPNATPMVISQAQPFKMEPPEQVLFDSPTSLMTPRL